MRLSPASLSTELGQEGMVLLSKFRVIRNLRTGQASPVGNH